MLHSLSLSLGVCLYLEARLGCNSNPTFSFFLSETHHPQTPQKISSLCAPLWFPKFSLAFWFACFMPIQMGVCGALRKIYNSFRL
ncbi:hypothetical protein RchiOBHm_Chr1g0363591 [Rosa chinensis]|uniref:Secreted protein n=1 Tax=Rosa chinensis TaxID=74649 RepID=A0A2P6SJI9_ROSCH|nr:hypothetical protein RchiOBHm_Chr1g0363591 [Rosa chinensis]